MSIEFELKQHRCRGTSTAGEFHSWVIDVEKIAFDMQRSLVARVFCQDIRQEQIAAGSPKGYPVAVSPIATSFRIDARGSQQALVRLIGEHYAGIVHSDRGSAYHVLANEQRQLCWSHLLRN